MSNATIAFLYPGLGVAEDDLEWLTAQLFPDGAVRARILETPIEQDLHTVEALLDLGQDWRLREGALPLSGDAIDAVLWACTSGSFVFGWDGARHQVEELGRFTKVPTSSTSLAFVNALQSLGIKRVSIAATYPEPVTSCFVRLLGDAGFEVVAASSNDIPTATAAGEVPAGSLVAMATAGDHADAEAVLIPDTALHTVRFLPELERILGKPVLSANQVTVWEGLRLIGATPAPHDTGTHLFAAG
jgi:maleate cis-trans isomerase